MRDRLSVYLGPNTARNALRSCAQKTVGIAAEELTLGQAQTVVEALRPMLKTLLGAVDNFFGVVSIGSFARAYLVAGLEMPGPRWRRAAAVTGGTLFASIFAGAPLVDAATRLADHDLPAIVTVVSAAGDLAIAV